MKLGEIIDFLKMCRPALQIRFDFGAAVPTVLDSYRGTYAHLAVGYMDGSKDVGDFLRECKNAVGKKFTGWRGDKEYGMGVDTEVWVAHRGEHTQTGIIRLAPDELKSCIIIHTGFVESNTVDEGSWLCPNCGTRQLGER